jgi:HSP20 family protein
MKSKKVALSDMMSDFPIRDYMTSFEQEMHRMFDQFRQDMYYFNDKAVRASSFMVEETDDKFNVSAIIKNVKKEELKVNIHRGFLSVSAEQNRKETIDNSKDKSGDSKEKVLEYSQFRKVFRLPKNVQVDKAEVQFKDDILTISIPKTTIPEEKPIQLEVK